MTDEANQKEAAPEKKADHAEGKGSPQPDPAAAHRELTPDEHVQMSHAAIIAGHAQALQAVVAGGGPQEVAQVHVDAIVQNANALADHTDTVATKTQDAKIAAAGLIVAPAATVTKAAGTNWSHVMLGVAAGAAGVAAAIVMHARGLF